MRGKKKHEVGIWAWLNLYIILFKLCFEITELTLAFVPLGKGQGEVRAPAEGERRFGYDGHGTTGADRYL